MTRRTEIALAVLIILILIAVLLFLFRRSESVDTNAPTTNNTETVTPSTDVDTTSVPEPPTHATPSTVGRIFVERFGSYSTDADYANVDDVLPLATANLKVELQDLAEEARQTSSGAYYGVSTNVIKITVDAQTDTTQSLTIKTQREESFDSPANTSVRYQDIRVEFVKIGEDWLVDSFVWL